MFFYKICLSNALNYTDDSHFKVFSLSHVLPAETLWRRNWAARTWLADHWTLRSPLKSRVQLRPCSSSSLLESILWRTWRNMVTHIEHICQSFSCGNMLHFFWKSLLNSFLQVELHFDSQHHDTMYSRLWVDGDIVLKVTIMRGHWCIRGCRE